MSKDKKEKKQKKDKIKKIDDEATVVKQVEEQNEQTENATAANIVANKENEATTIDTDHKNDDNLMAVDLSTEAPLSRKQRRLKKKEEMIEKSLVKEEKAKQESQSKPKRSEYGIWIGNLSFATNKKMLQEFFSSCGKPTRIHLPCTRPGVNRG